MHRPSHGISACQHAASPCLPQLVIDRHGARPPQVVLHQACAAAMDVWSLGCILAELSLHRPLFPASSASLLLQLVSCCPTCLCLMGVCLFCGCVTLVCSMCQR